MQVNNYGDCKTQEVDNIKENITREKNIQIEPQ